MAEDLSTANEYFLGQNNKTLLGWQKI